MNRATSPIGMLMKKIQFQPDVVGDHAAQARPDQRRHPEHGSEQPQVLAPLGGGVQVGDDREGDREDRAAAQALEATEQDELPHLLAEAAERRADQEQADREDHDRAAAVQVRELAVDRAADRGRQEVDGHGPRVQVVAVKLGDDPRQRDAHDGLVEREQEHCQQDRAEDLELGPRRQVQGGVGGVLGALGGVGRRSRMGHGFLPQGMGTFIMGPEGVRSRQVPRRDGSRKLIGAVGADASAGTGQPERVSGAAGSSARRGSRGRRSRSPTG